MGTCNAFADFPKAAKLLWETVQDAKIVSPAILYRVLSCPISCLAEELESPALCRCADWDHNGNLKSYDDERFQCTMLCSLTATSFRIDCAYIIFNRQLVQYTLVSLCVNGFALITQKKLPVHATGPLFGADGIHPEAYSRTSWHERAFHYIVDVLFDMLHD